MQNAKGLGTYCIYWLGMCYSSLYLCCSFAPNLSSQYLAHTKMYERHIHKAMFEQTKWIDAQGSIIRLTAAFMSRAGDKSECRVSLSCGGELSAMAISDSVRELASFEIVDHFSS